MTSRPLRIALLSYRAHPEVGGQGVYVRNLSSALAHLGHEVTVFAGQPYPELDGSVALAKVPSLDLYRPEDPFRRPRRDELRGPVDLLEYGLMCTGAFPEPLTFSLRVGRHLPGGSFDVVHDNQCLGYGLLAVARRLPMVATVHHPISVDRRIAISEAADRKERIGRRRWYSFVPMQARVARTLPRLLTVSRSSRSEIVRDFRVPGERIAVVPNGVDTDLFRPLPDVARVSGRLVTIASSDQPGKGLVHLVEALAKLRTEREAELVVIGKGGLGEVLAAAVRRFGLEGVVHAVGRVDALEMVRLYAQAEAAVIPSLYEGFSLPAIEAMACAVPLVATSGGALGEVVGDGGAGLLVPPADAGALATAINKVLEDEALRTRMGEQGRRRVLDRFTWDQAAARTAEHYRTVIAGC